MRRISDKKISEAISVAESKTGAHFSQDTVRDVLQHSCRKLRIIKQDLEYLPILFENELIDHASRTLISLKGAGIYV